MIAERDPLRPGVAIVDDLEQLSGLELWDYGRAVAATAVDAAFSGDVDHYTTMHLEFARVVIAARVRGVSERAASKRKAGQ